jgi:hypothetical protein
MNHAEQDEQRHQEQQEIADKETMLFERDIRPLLSCIDKDTAMMYLIGAKYENINTDAIIEERVNELLS